VLAQPIDETIARHLDEKRPQVLNICETPPRIRKLPPQACPYRLDHIAGIEFGPKPLRYASADDFAKVGLINGKSPLRRSLVATRQGLQESTKGIN
jgi:hypothetical protein